MVVLHKPALERVSLISSHGKNGQPTARVPVVDLSKPDASSLVKACEEVGFFKVTNHGISASVTNRLEEEAMAFFSKSLREKELLSGQALSVGYGNKKIGPNGDEGWLEYLLMQINCHGGAAEPVLSLLKENGASSLCVALEEYLTVVKRLACRVLELLAEGLGLSQRNALSRLLADEDSDSMFRLNHYPPCPQPCGQPGFGLTGFGEHTDPQIISLLRSNNINGLQILRDGCWVSVPADQSSFFVNVGDSLQVMTNGRFRSVRHRVLLGNTIESRVSMIYFGGPPPKLKLAPLPVLMAEGESSLYREFTWAEYKKAAYATRLADNRLGFFEIWRGPS
ncbi:gibberellin 2-beta-dioxygenase-like [Wolffia australiana]